MTRAQHRPAHRPPARRDSRRPAATAPPRTPAGRPASTASTASPDEAPSPTGPTAPRTAPDGPAPAAHTGQGHPATTAPHLPVESTARASSPDRGLPSPTGTTPPRIPTGRAASAPSPGGRRPAAAALPARPADNRPPARAGRRAVAPAPSARGTREAPTAGTRPRVTDRPPHHPVVLRPGPTDRFAELLLAVLSGQRPVHAMLRHTAGQAYDELVRLAEHGPLRTRGVRPVVRDIGWFEPREGALEVFARIGAGDRLRAMAFRLEQGRDLRWRCTAVELGGPRAHRAATH
ncbi:Rv3235 family protein [Streptomyces sp. NPDC059454]|uniref:Rv3235 family protein n=1 Tax=Streptomyces sp. NPDC059454 TaxID=3346836 RepID=UPI003687C223